MKCDLSIIISVYNAEDRIASVIDALVSQNYSKNYEIILVNDGSTDGSLKIMQGYAKRYSKGDRVVKVISQKNHGAAYGRNNGIKNSSGEILVLTDDDVILEKDWLMKTMKLFRGPEDSDIFVISIIKNDTPSDLNSFELLLFDYALASRGANIKNEGSMFMTNAFRKSTVEKVGLYDVNFGGSGAGADVDLWLRCRDNGCKLVVSQAKSVHLETRKRFQLGFFILKPLQWGRSTSGVAQKNGLNKFNFLDRLLIFPLPLSIFIISIILCIINWRFIALPILGFIIYLFIRMRLIKSLMERKRNIFEILFLCVLDIIRVLIYNIGSISSFLSSNKKHRS